MSPTITSRTAVTTIVLATLFCAAAVGAAESGDPLPATTVDYADLNLDSKAGLVQLYQRIEHAADQVCELPRETRRLKPEADLRKCKARVTDRTVMRVDLPALNALHFAKTGRGVSPDRLAKAR